MASPSAPDPGNETNDGEGAAAGDDPLRVEIWSDVVCPWCYIGKRRFERAVSELAGEVSVEAVYRPYLLDPTAPIGSPRPVREVYARKFGGPERADQILRHLTDVAAAEGIEFRLDRAQRSNTRDAHRLLCYAERVAGRSVQAALKEELLRAYFTDGLDVGDRHVLVARAEAVGLAGPDVAGLLAGATGIDEVERFLQHAHDHGITAVPTYVIGAGVIGAQRAGDGSPTDAHIEGRWAVPGAQEPATFVQVIRRMAARRAATRG